MSTDESSRRAYWAEQMEAGKRLIEELATFPVKECGEGLADIPAAAEAAGVEMLFSNTEIVDDLDRVHFIREGLIDDLLAVGRDMNARGWVLKIEDAFRSREMQTRLGRKRKIFDMIVRKCMWECNGEIPAPELVFRRAQVLIANQPLYGTHMSASAVDISVFDRDSRNEIWRGFPYLEMSECTPMRSPFITAQDLRHRLQITSIVEARGFVHYPHEFWHYNKDDAMGNLLAGIDAPARYGPVDWDPRTNTVKTIENRLQYLNPLDAMEAEITSALERSHA